MKKRILALIMALSLILLISCAKTKTQTENTLGSTEPISTSITELTNTSDSTTAGNSINTTTSKNATTKENTTAKITTTAKALNVFFIGNSLLIAGQIKFRQIANANNRPVNILQNNVSAYTLSKHYNDLKSGNYNDKIASADIVVLQETGYFGIDTANAVKNIQKLFKPNVKFYMLLTEFDIPGRVNELKDVKNITFIPSGYVHNLLLNNGFTYDQLHLPHDFHPNELYGYAIGLTVYSKIFNVDCRGPYDFLESFTISAIPGNTKAEKDQSVAKIQNIVMQAVKADISKYS